MSAPRWMSWSFPARTRTIRRRLEAELEAAGPAPLRDGWTRRPGLGGQARRCPPDRPCPGGLRTDRPALQLLHARPRVLPAGRADRARGGPRSCSASGWPAGSTRWWTRGCWRKSAAGRRRTPPGQDSAPGPRLRPVPQGPRRRVRRGAGRGGNDHRHPAVRAPPADLVPGGPRVSWLDWQDPELVARAAGLSAPCPAQASPRTGRNGNLGAWTNSQAVAADRTAGPDHCSPSAA